MEQGKQRRANRRRREASDPALGAGRGPGPTLSRQELRSLRLAY